MLEHAEVSITEAKKLSQCTSLRKTDGITDRISAIINLANELWPTTSLPHDMKRFAENISNLMHNVSIDLQTLRQVLIKETELGRGINVLNLSPYSTIVQSLLNQKQSKMRSYLTGHSKTFKIYIPQELDIPDGYNPISLTNAIVVNNAKI